MASNLEPCPFCGSCNMHISHHLLSRAVCCQHCKATGPHRRTTEEAVLNWNRVSKCARQQVQPPNPQIHGHLHNLEDAVRSLASILRHGPRQGLGGAAEADREH